MAAALLALTSGGADPAIDLTDRIIATYRMPNGYYRDKQGTDQPAFNWGVGVEIAALNAAAKASDKYIPVLTAFVEKTHSYWNDAGPVAGYDVLPAPKPIDRYYDDNEWMVLALVNTYRLTKDRKYLTWAEDTMRYVLSGEDETLGGGIYWRESDRGASKNACSNGPAAAGLLELYRETKDEAKLRKAKQIYDWTYKTLRDPEDGLISDNINKDGRVERTKWTYNTALMIDSAANLYDLTKESRYRSEAEAFAKAAYAHWVKPDGSISCEGKFAHMLVEAFRTRERIAPTDWRIAPGAYGRIRTYVLTQLPDGKGWYGHRWDSKPTGDIKDPELIDQAAAARLLFALRDLGPT